MPYLHKKYYMREKDEPQCEKIFKQGYSILENHPLLRHLDGDVYMRGKNTYEKGSAATVDKSGDVHINTSAKLNPKEWAYVLAHCLLHLAFKHFDNDSIPYDEDGSFHKEVWNKACDIYITRFLRDIKFCESMYDDPAQHYSIKLDDEKKIYKHLLYLGDTGKKQEYGTNSPMLMDMIGLDHPIVYKPNTSNKFSANFALSIAHSVTNAVNTAGGHNPIDPMARDTSVMRAARWFLTNYPLLGGIAASFKIIEDYEICQRDEIHIAAVDASIGEIYANPTANLSTEEWKFVLAHEFLHAGLLHHKRCLGRDKYLWNVACDYVINDWLLDMKVGAIPDEGLLYDEELHGLSAEAVYDKIVKEMRKFKKHATFRGFGHGDIMSDRGPSFGGLGKEAGHKGVSLDEFFKNALREGYDFYSSNARGFLPAGLVAEIRALSMPPIPWEVELGKWFDYQFPPLEKHRSYARPSRRQGATPDIPRPRYIVQQQNIQNRTFGVVVDTSGSMSFRQIGLALGAIASYAISKDVLFVRVVFCDATAYDAGYMAPDDIAGRVKVTGGGGTILQPGVSLLEKAFDFPADGPILIITDGYIEENLRVTHQHAFLLPKGNKLPFIPKGEVFYFL